MVGGDADVLVEVEGGELRPVDPGLLPERGQELVLRGRGGEDDGGPAVARQEVPDGARPPRERPLGPSWDGSGRPRRAGGRSPRTRAPGRSAAERPRRWSAAQPRKCGSATSGSSISGCQRFSHSKETQRGGAVRREPVQHARGREVAAAGQDRGPGDLAVWRAPHVLEVDVAQEGAERGRAGFGLLAELREGVGGVPHRAEPVAPRLLEQGAGRGGGREVAVRLEPDLDAGAAEAVAQVGQGLDDPASRRGEIGARLHAVAEDADAARPQPRREARRALRLLDRRGAARRGRGCGRRSACRRRGPRGRRRRGGRASPEGRSPRARAGPRARRRPRGSAARRRRSRAGRRRRGRGRAARTDSRVSRRRA